MCRGVNMGGKYAHQGGHVRWGWKLVVTSDMVNYIFSGDHAIGGVNVYQPWGRL